jgi:GT2 family glycosyltransferase
MAEGLGGCDDDGGSPARHPGRIGSVCTAIVPAWNAEATIARTLDSLVNGNAGAVARVVVAVSGNDRTARIAGTFPGVEVVELGERASAGRARNAGRALARDAELLLFVDADCALEPGSAATLIEGLYARGLVAAGAAIVGEGGGAVGWMRHLLEFKEAEPGVVVRSPYFLPSAAGLVRASAFDRVGAFPDMWPGEDLVLGRRLAAAGHIRKIDAAVARHVHPASITAFVRHQVALGATAARARRMEPVPGAVFVARPHLAPVMVFGRFARALVWLVRYRARSLVYFLCLSPLYFAGLGAWTLGFYRGRAGVGAFE